MLTATDPTGGADAWTTTNVDGANSLSSVSCASSDLCVAVDNSGNVVTATDPTGGAGAWTTTSVDAGNNRDWRDSHRAALGASSVGRFRLLLSKDAGQS